MHLCCIHVHMANFKAHEITKQNNALFLFLHLFREFNLTKAVELWHHTCDKLV